MPAFAGRDRVYSLRPTSPPEVFPVACDAVLWNGTLNRSEYVTLSIASDLSITQSAPIASSAVNGIWGAVGVLSGTLYVYNIGALKFERWVDSNQDGVFDQLDANFGLSVPITWAPDNSNDSKVCERFGRTKKNRLESRFFAFCFEASLAFAVVGLVFDFFGLRARCSCLQRFHEGLFFVGLTWFFYLLQAGIPAIVTEKVLLTDNLDGLDT